jgi:hypothetical protein
MVKNLAIIVQSFKSDLKTLQSVLSSLTETAIVDHVYILDYGTPSNVLDSASELLKLKGLPYSIVKFSRDLGVPLMRNRVLCKIVDEYEYIMFTDNDVIVAKEAIQELFDAAKSLKFFGAIQPTIVDRNYERTAQSLSLLFVGIPLLLRSSEEGCTKSSKLIPCLYPSGCCFIASAIALKAIKALDHHIEIWYDDVDLGLTFWKNGYPVYAAPWIKVYHVGSLSWRAGSYERAFRLGYAFEKFKYYAIVKHFGLKLQVIVLLLLSSVISIPLLMARTGACRAATIKGSFYGSLHGLANAIRVYGNKKRWAASNPIIRRFLIQGTYVAFKFIAGKMRALWRVLT